MIVAALKDVKSIKTRFKHLVFGYVRDNQQLFESEDDNYCQRFN